MRIRAAGIHHVNLRLRDVAKERIPAVQYQLWGQVKSDLRAVGGPRDFRYPFAIGQREHRLVPRAIVIDDMDRTLRRKRCIPGLDARPQHMTHKCHPLSIGRNSGRIVVHPKIKEVATGNINLTNRIGQLADKRRD